MPCPTCDGTMANLGVESQRVFWCQRCGTVQLLDSETGSYSAPALVARVRALLRRSGGLPKGEKAVWHQLGLFEAIYRPEERP